MSKQINIGGRVHSVEVDNVVAGANEILDDAKGKKQNVINSETDAELLRLDQSKQNNLTFDNTPTENSNNPVKSSGVYAADKALSDAIEAILILIPSAATALNQLADKSFVNSSIATDTATFRGTSETGLSEAQFLEWANSLTHDMNDYVFWQTIDEAGNTLFKRYKWNGTQWLYEYTLNNSSFTADQWAAIMSGITSALVEKLNGLPTNAALQQALNGKQDALTFDNVPTENSTNPVKSGGVYSAVKAEEDARLNLAQTVNEIGGDVSQIEDVIPADATAQNQLVANASMEAYVASIINNITASFTLSTTDGHINLTLTQVNGQVATLTLTSSDIASAQALTALTGRVTTAEGNITSLTGRVSTNETDIANLQQLYNNLQQSKPVPVTALPETGQQQGVIYRLAGTTSYSDYMWNGSTWVLMATYNNAIDPRPKKASQNLVTSGGVFDNMGALDVSELNATENPHTLAQYVDLSAALAAIPTDYQKGGMSVKFVCSVDNKYVQYLLVKNTWSTNVNDWQSSNFLSNVGFANPIEGVFSYNSSTKVLSFPARFDIVGNLGSGRVSYSGRDINFSSYSSLSRERVLAFDWTDKSFKVFSGDHNGYRKLETGNYVVLGIVDNNTGQEYFNFNYTRDGVAPHIIETIDNVNTKSGYATLKSEQIFKNVQLDGKVGSYFTFEGQGTTQINFCLYLTKNRKYKVSGLGWQYTESDQAKLFLYGKKTDGQDILLRFSYNDTRKFFTFTDTNDTSYLCYVLVVRANTGTNQVIHVEDITELDVVDSALNDRIDDIESSISGSSNVALMANAYHGNHWDFFPFFKEELDDKYWQMEQNSTWPAFLEKVTGRSGSGKYQIAFITDTHEGGLYAPESYAFRCIGLFNKLTQYTDIAMHGGDISCDYGTSKTRYFAYMQEVMKLFNINGGKNFLITKGNHDAKDFPYEEISPMNVDWEHGTYYTMNGATATQVTKQTYRGGELYIGKNDLMPDSLFRFIQANNAPVDAVWGDGAYYYWDNDTIKIRFVVRNSFPVNDSGVIDESDEWKWFAEEALDLSDKNTPTDWLVVCLGHTETSSYDKFNTVVGAFMNGISMSIDETTVDYGTLNGGGIKFVHLHGHEHGSAGYSNMAGYLDLGFAEGNVAKDELGKPSHYKVYVLTIDTINKKLISDQMLNNITYNYDYANNIIELSVGQNALMARSGTPQQSAYTWTSSDNTIATVASNGVVTGVSAGNVTITGTYGTKVVTYTIKVVS